MNFDKSLSPCVLQFSICKMDIIAFTYPWGYCEDSFIKGVSNLETFPLDAHKKNCTNLGSPLNSAKQPHKHFMLIFFFFPGKNLKLLNENEHRNMENKFLNCSQKDKFQTSLQSLNKNSHVFPEPLVESVIGLMTVFQHRPNLP